MDPSSENERRSYVRITYPPQSGAVMHVGSDRLHVADISQCGIRVFRTATGPAVSRVAATLHLLCGTSIEVKAELEWQEEKEAGYSLSAFLPAGLIERELRYVTLHFD